MIVGFRVPREKCKRGDPTEEMVAGPDGARVASLSKALQLRGQVGGEYCRCLKNYQYSDPIGLT